MKSIELFAGAGGLALGCQLAGFNSLGVVEWDQWACDTVRQNKAQGYPLVVDWNVIQGDVRDVDWTQFGEDVDLVAGGPPCQPFSMGGKARAADDRRDMFPAATEAIRTLRPRAFILENVRGLTRTAFANYFQYILLRLEHPELVSRSEETWFEHLLRLQREHTSVRSDLKYNVTATLVNAANYGVPQQRHRVFMVGFRSDVDAEWNFPLPTHSKAALDEEQWQTGEYWDRHRIRKPKVVPQRPLESGSVSELRPWRTVRDALEGLPEPSKSGSKFHLNHTLQEGARSYPGHTGSLIDLPAKTLKAGDHGVPGGENMIRRQDGSIRYFSVRESARLQTFPDAYELHGSWSEAMRQLGNAVPVVLAQTVAGSVARHLAIAGFRETAAERRPASTISA